MGSISTFLRKPSAPKINTKYSRLSYISAEPIDIRGIRQPMTSSKSTLGAPQIRQIVLTNS